MASSAFPLKVKNGAILCLAISSAPLTPKGFYHYENQRFQTSRAGKRNATVSACRNAIGSLLFSGATLARYIVLSLDSFDLARRVQE
jgi:hypothetical protein